MPEHDPDDPLIWGAENIARELNLVDENGKAKLRKVFHLLECRLLPADKCGGQWVARRSRLRSVGGGAV